MKRKDETENAARQPDPPAAPDAAAGTETGDGGKPADSIVDIGPEVEAMVSEMGTEADPSAEKPTPEQAQLAALTDRLLRLQADFDNFRKRTNRERDDLRKRAGEAVLEDMIPILDNLEFGLRQAMAKPGGESFVEGLRLIQTQLTEAVRKHGLEGVDALGKPFDPREHEAVAYAPSAEAPEGIVTAQSRRGYRLGERLLRAAGVVVSSGPAKTGNGG